MMSGQKSRQKLQEALCRYTTDTLTYINTVSGFFEGISSWMDAREKELSKLNEIKDKADKVELSFSHVTDEALGENMKNDVTPETTYSNREELLTAVLKFTLGGLKKLDHFLEAVEKLAVTSLHVFMEENQVLHLPKGISLEHVQVVITAARQICPLLLKFKRDASVFFLPKLQNVEVLSYKLDEYIKTTRIICEMFEKSLRLQMTENHLPDLGGNLSEDDIQRIVCHINQHYELRLRFQRTPTDAAVNLDVDLSEDEIQMMLDHINQLHKIRMDQNFRLVFLFQEFSCSGFISEFKERQPRMLQFLTDLEEGAVQLDRMNKGAKISSVTGSSVSAAGGVISIVGLALSPVTAGLSLGLTIGGATCGITSGVNTIVTTAGSVVVKGGTTSRIVSRAPAKRPALSALSKTVRVGLIVANAFCIGLDVFFICKDGYGLYKGSETEVSKFIRARVALWSSEMDSWKKIHDSLCEGQKTSEEHRAVLDETFYPVRAIKMIKKSKKKNGV